MKRVHLWLIKKMVSEKEIKAVKTSCDYYSLLFVVYSILAFAGIILLGLYFNLLDFASVDWDISKWMVLDGVNHPEGFEAFTYDAFINGCKILSLLLVVFFIISFALTMIFVAIGRFQNKLCRNLTKKELEEIS